MRPRARAIVQGRALLAAARSAFGEEKVILAPWRHYWPQDLQVTPDFDRDVEIWEALSPAGELWLAMNAPIEIILEPAHDACEKGSDNLP